VAASDAPSIYFYTGGFTHTFYRHQFACSPGDFRMLPSTPELVSDGMKSDIRAAGTLGDRLSRGAKRGAIAFFQKAGIPNVRRIRVAQADLIHGAQHIVRSRQPWVVDFEDVSVFFWYRRGLMKSRRARRTVEQLLGSPACRRLLPWSEAAKESLASLIGVDEILAKMEVVYPSIRTPAAAPVPDHSDDVVRLLFVGTRFYEKGGLETLRAFKLLRQTSSVELTMVTFVPEEARREIGAIEGVTVLTQATPERMSAEFARADVFVLPAHTDTFGFVYLEGFAAGTPCVGVHHFAVPEIISHGRTGFVVAGENSYFGPDRLPRFDPVHDASHPLIARLKEPSDAYVTRLAETIGRLVEDSALRREMSIAAFHEVRSGRFSCTRRRETMARIYEEALT
jgi:glycosyltransferase involved in cell wall biosynthesis